MAQVDLDAVSCRKRPWADFVLQGYCLPLPAERERKTYQRTCSSEHGIAASPATSAQDQSQPATSSESASALDQSQPTASSGSACWEDDEFVDQFCVSETIRSLEAELGIRSEQEASSCSRNEDKHGICRTIPILGDPYSAESERLSWEEDEMGDSLVDSGCSAYSDSSIGEGAVLPKVLTSDEQQLDYSFLWEILDDQLGLLHNLSSELLQVLSGYHEGETVCSFPGFSEDTYGCTQLDEDFWGLSERPCQ